VENSPPDPPRGAQEPLTYRFACASILFKEHTGFPQSRGILREIRENGVKCAGSGRILLHICVVFSWIHRIRIRIRLDWIRIPGGGMK